MSIRVLERKAAGNIKVFDGIINNYINSNLTNGTLPDVLSGCTISNTTNSITLATGYLYIRGIRVAIDTAETITFASLPAEKTAYQLVLKITLDSGDVTHEIQARPNQTLTQEDLLKYGYGIYEYELASFYLSQDGISNLINLIDVINIGGGAGGGVGFVPEGIWSVDRAYGITKEGISWVSYEGQSFYAIQAIIPVGTLPTDTAYWALGAGKGAAANSIIEVIKTNTVGYVDTYTITYSDSSTTTFTITNANIQSTNNVLIGDGIGGAVDSGIPASTILNTLSAVNPTGNPINIQNTNDGFIDKIKIVNNSGASISSPLTGKSIGKNILNIANASVLGGSLTITKDLENRTLNLASAVGAYGAYLDNVLILKPNTNYVCKVVSSWNLTKPTNWGLRLYNVVTATYGTYQGDILSFNTGTYSQYRIIYYLNSPTVVPTTVILSEIQLELETATTYEPYTATGLSIPLKDTSGSVLSLAAAAEIKLIDGKYCLGETELHDDSQDALRSIPTYQGQTNLYGNQAVTFDITEFQLGLESLDAMLTLPNGKRVNVITKDRLIFIASGEHKGKTLDYVLQEMQNDIDAKATDSEVIKKTGDQTKAGVLTFSSSPIVPNATTSSQAVNKGQLDNMTLGSVPDGSVEIAKLNIPLPEMIAGCTGYNTSATISGMQIYGDIPLSGWVDSGARRLQISIFAGTSVEGGWASYPAGNITLEYNGSFAYPSYDGSGSCVIRSSGQVVGLSPCTISLDPETGIASVTICKTISYFDGGILYFYESNKLYINAVSKIYY